MYLSSPGSEEEEEEEEEINQKKKQKKWKTGIDDEIGFAII